MDKTALLTELQSRIADLEIWDALCSIEDFDVVELQSEIWDAIWDSAHPIEEDEDV